MSEVVDDDVRFPTELSIPEVNANTMILFGKEKCGKTTALSQLENCLIIDTEKGTRKLACIAVSPPKERGPVGKMAWLKRVGEKLIEDGKKYDYVAIDTLTEVNEWAEWSGTFKYMNSSQGKSFNRVKDGKGMAAKGGKFLDPSDIDYESVHSLPEGYGYRWSRDEVMRIFNLFCNVAKKCVIFVCHIEDKYVGLKDTTDLVVPKQLALTGKLREILPRKVDVIGHVYNEKGKINVNFTGSEEKLGGGRAKHLLTYNGPLDWSKIFI